ncbi:MAG TPA: MBL fold metallo-hydrolase [Thermoanaerobaculia bacterium]|nr:MBL fold metallo-hydrolase [Thermoanaerobaculia bacterium]
MSHLFYQSHSSIRPIYPPMLNYSSMHSSSPALTLLLLLGCAGVTNPPLQSVEPFAMVLGIAQDGGLPHAGCNREHCVAAARDPSLRRHVASLAIVDPVTDQRWLLDATPDFPHQLRMLDEAYPIDAPSPGLAGIFLTHAHIGHYTGLMHLGREVLGSRGVPVFAMPRMKRFLESNGPWDQLVRLGNIAIQPLEEGARVRLNERIAITPFLVPHRDEYSETVGFRIEGPSRTILFIPDIDKWSRWERRIEDLVREADVALVDGTFFDAAELPGRDMSEIPHPFIVESLAAFSALPPEDRSKVVFIHLNHSNPALDPTTGASRVIEDAGMRVAVERERIAL